MYENKLSPGMVAEPDGARLHGAHPSLLTFPTPTPSVRMPLSLAGHSLH